MTRSDFDDAWWAARGMAREFTSVLKAIKTLANNGMISEKHAAEMLGRLYWGISPETPPSVAVKVKL